MKTQWMLICALIFALITACFAVINVESVNVNFLFAQSQIPLILIILGSTLLGGLIVGFFGIIRQFRLQRTIRQLTKQLNAVTEPADRLVSPSDSAKLPGELPKDPSQNEGSPEGTMKESPTIEAGKDAQPKPMTHDQRG